MRVFNTDPRFDPTLDLAREAVKNELEAAAPPLDESEHSTDDSPPERSGDRAETTGQAPGETA